MEKLNNFALKRVLAIFVLILFIVSYANATISKRVGLFIASVDPITTAHMDVIETGIEQLNLEKVIIMVNSFSDKDYSASVQERIALVRIALAKKTFENIEFQVLSEPSEGKRNFAIRIAHQDGGGLIFAVGGEDIQAKAQELYKNAPEISVYIVPRLNQNETAAEPKILASFNLLKPKRVTSISSSEVKERLENGFSVEGMMDSAVIAEIHRMGLYSPLSDEDAKYKGTLLLKKMNLLFAHIRSSKTWSELNLPSIQNENTFVLRQGVDVNSNLSFNRIQSMQASEELIVRLILKKNPLISKSQQFEFHEWAMVQFSSTAQQSLNQKFKSRIKHSVEIRSCKSLF